MKNKEIQAKIAKKRRQIEKLEEQLKEPKFKVGDFIKILDYTTIKIMITRIDTINTVIADGFDENGIYVENEVFGLRNAVLMTNKQILEHLIKVAELKGLVEGVKIKNQITLINRKDFFIEETSGNLCQVISSLGYMTIWNKETNTWAEKVEVDFSILNYEDVFYVKTDENKEWLAKGNIISFGEGVKTYHYCITSGCTYEPQWFSLCRKKDIKTLRKATEEEIKLFNSKFTKYRLKEIRSEFLIYYGDKFQCAILNKQLAKDICEFLNNKL